jgi:rRNA processing protein Krr1/Pno1
MLIQGAPHKTVTSFLEKKYKEKKDESAKKLWKPDFSDIFNFQ